MPYRVEIVGAPFAGARHAALAESLTLSLGIAKQTADLLASGSPCIVEDVASTAELDALTTRLSGQGFTLHVLGDRGSSGYKHSHATANEEDLHGDGFKDYYSLLGVSTTATLDEINRAYRTKSKEYHPDLFQNSPRLSFYIRMQQTLNEAYSVLTDAAKRNRYDREYEAQRAQRSGGGQNYSRAMRAQDEFVIALGFLDQDELALAMEALNKALFLDPELLEAELLLASLYLELGAFDQARMVATRLARRPDAQYQSLITLAQCDLRDPNEGELADAILRCEQAIAENPKEPTAYQVKAFALINSGRSEEAVGFLEATIEEYGRHPVLLLALASAYADLYEFAAAVRCVDEAEPNINAGIASEVRNELRVARAGREEMIAGVTVKDVKREVQGGGLGTGYWVSAAVLTLVPPHFWGVLVLAFGLLETGSNRKEKKRKADYRQRKGLTGPEKRQKATMRSCIRCDSCTWSRVGTAHPRCEQLGQRLDLSKSRLDDENPCHGLLFINTQRPGSYGTPEEPFYGADRTERSTPTGTPYGMNHAQNASRLQARGSREWDLTERSDKKVYMALGGIIGVFLGLLSGSLFITLAFIAIGTAVAHLLHAKVVQKNGSR